MNRHKSPSTSGRSVGSAAARLRAYVGGLPRGVLIAYAGLGFILWMLPLVNRLHVESCAIVAAVAFFAAGWSSLAHFRALKHEAGSAEAAEDRTHIRGGAGVRKHEAANRSFARELVRQETALLVPLVMLTVSMLWAPNCGYPLGLLFFGLFPVISVALAVAAAYAVAATSWKRMRLWFTLAGFAVIVAGPIYDIGLHPQFYTYNHVFGGVLGPLYDEELALRAGLFWFRGLTLVWAGFFALLGLWMRRRRGAGWTAVVAVVIVLIYANSARLGLNTPAWYLQERLGAVKKTEHFAIYYDPDSIDDATIDRLADDHEFHYQRMAAQLETAPGERILSYLYPSPGVKAALTGARQTNIAPVWLARPQVHVREGAFDDSFAHELAHAFSRSFALPVIRASLAVGLVEGFAVAMEPPDGRPTPDEQVIAAISTLSGFEKERLAEALASRLSPFGFWTSRGAVSYTMMGSFVGYLLRSFDPALFREAYAAARFEAVYGRSLKELAAGWIDELERRSALAQEAAPVAARRFSRPSLFEEACPHYVPRYLRRYRGGVRALARGDSTRAERQFEASLELQPLAPQVLAAWSALALSRAHPQAVIGRFTGREAMTRAVRGSPVLLVRLGDALAMAGRSGDARRQYRRARRELPLYAHDARLQTMLRYHMAVRPPIIRILNSGSAPAERARQLMDSVAARADSAQTVDEMAGRMAEDKSVHDSAAETISIKSDDGLASWEFAVYLSAALLLDAADAPQQALSLFNPGMRGLLATSSPSERLIIERVAAAWRGRLHYHARNYPQARAAGARAAADFRAAGDLNSAARYDLFADKMRWLATK